jgi:hypothetical protein
MFLAPTLLLVHSVSARLYYNLNSSTLAINVAHAASMAAERLPMEPALAAQTADRCLKGDGIELNEIVLTAVSADHRTMTIVLNRQAPALMAFLAVRLPSQEIRVTASAQK